MNVRRRSRISAGLAAATSAALALTGLTACSAADEACSGVSDGGKLGVVTSFYPLKYLAEQVGGTHVAACSLTSPGQEPHDLELSARQTASLQDAGVILYLKGLQPAVDDAVAQAPNDHKVDAAALTGQEGSGTEDHDAGHGHGHDHEEHADEPPGEPGHEEHEEHGHGHGDHEEHGNHEAHEHGTGGDQHDHSSEPGTGPRADDDAEAEAGAHDESHDHTTEAESEAEAEPGHEGHEGHEGHDHGGKDPHIWLDPVKFAEVAEGVGKAFAKADPDHAAEYRANAETLADKLHALDERYAAGLKNTRTKVFITTHAAFGHLAERYGLTEESVSGLDPSSTPSAARVRELQEIAKEDKVGTVFYETLVSGDTARTLARDAGLEADVLDPLEGITDRSKGDDYLEVMDANLAALRSALGAR